MMFSLLFHHDTKQKEKNVQAYLKKFYNSFFSDTYNELNIGRYRQIRDAISLVLNKFDSQDHPLEYTSKLVMYIQARVVLKHLRLSRGQAKLLTQIETETKDVNLSYLYSGRIDSAEQFFNA